jgi:hypothetical protein
MRRRALLPQSNSNGCSVSARSIDGYLKSKNSPMAGQGAAIMGAGASSNIDPRLLVALAGAESGFGSNVTRGANNAWNWGYRSFSSFGAGAAVVASGLSRLYGLPQNNFDVGYRKMYCTTGSTCAAGQENMHKFMAQQGGQMGALAYPCGRGGQ